MTFFITRILATAVSVQLAAAAGTLKLGEKCGLQQAGPSLGDCMPGLDCVDQARRDANGVVTMWLEYAQCETPTGDQGDACGDDLPPCKAWLECQAQKSFNNDGSSIELDDSICDRPANVCIEEMIWWAWPTHPNVINSIPTVAGNVENMRSAGWDVKVGYQKTRQEEWTPGSENQLRHRIQPVLQHRSSKNGGFFANAQWQVKLRRTFQRAYQRVKVVFRANFIYDLDANKVEMEFSSPTNMRGQLVQALGPRNAEATLQTQTVYLEDVVPGDWIEFMEWTSVFELVEISAECPQGNGNNLPVAPPQPEGEKVTIKFVKGCAPEPLDHDVTMEGELIWAPFECQADPFASDDDEFRGSVSAGCRKDGTLQVVVWTNSATCEGESERFFVRHGEKMDFNEEDHENDERPCTTAFLDDKIRAACGTLPEETASPTAPPTARPVGPPVHCHTVGDPHFRNFEYYFDANGDVVNRPNQYFNFQSRGEYNLYSSSDLQVHVRHGSRLDFETTAVSTNNAVAVSGKALCDSTLEIYGYDGYSMKAYRNASPTEFYGATGITDILEGVPAMFNSFECAEFTVGIINVPGKGLRIQFRTGDASVIIEMKGYGINVWIDVEGDGYSPADTGICPGTDGWNTELNCDSLFTEYQGAECADVPTPGLPPINDDACDANLMELATQHCADACSDVITSEECVREVCAIGNVEAADTLLESCDIRTIPIIPVPTWVKCHSTGDPHMMFFDGVRKDFQARGEFLLYMSRGLYVGVRQGYRPDIPHRDDISTNHAVVINGPWARARLEFYYDETHGSDGPADPLTSATPMLKVNMLDNFRFVGADAIFEYLEGLEVPGLTVVTRRADNLVEFIMNEGKHRVRVQWAWWGLNVFVDTSAYLISDIGLCTRGKGLTWNPRPCKNTLFSEHRNNDCESVIVIPGRPHVPQIPEGCDAQLRADARMVCSACPEIVSAKECEFEACVVGSIDAAHQLATACGATPIVPLPVEPTASPTAVTTSPTPEPAVRPVGRPVNCHTAGDPHMMAFEYVYESESDIRWLTRQQRYFDFQSRGEYNLYTGNGISVHVRHGSRLDFTTTHVSTNNAVAISGDQLCGHTFEIYGYDGYSMKAYQDAADPQRYNGRPNILTGINAYKADMDCPELRVGTLALDGRSDRIQLVTGDVVIKIDMHAYGINVFVFVHGEAYLPSDTGICTIVDGWNSELNCNSLFTEYQGQNCGDIPTPVLPRIPESECDADLRAQAENRCDACPDVVAPEECVREVCAIGNIGAAAGLLESCDINRTPIMPVPAWVRCQSTGDPHFVYFDGVRRDFQARGEFILYMSRGLMISVRHGYRPDIPNHNGISTNHGVSIRGTWAQGMYEFYYDETHGTDGPADPVQSATPMLLVNREDRRVGSDAMFELLNELNDARTGVTIATRPADNLVEFIMNEGRHRVRVQWAWWGLNVFVDVVGSEYLVSDVGLCTRGRSGTWHPRPCAGSSFSEFRGGECGNHPVIPGVPAIPQIPETCPAALRQAAREVCDECPEIVAPNECLFEACTIGSIDAAHQLVAACRATPIVPLPTPVPAPKKPFKCHSQNDPQIYAFDGTNFENMDHATIQLYKSETLSVQTRQGNDRRFVPSHVVQGFQSTNNAIVVQGDLTCGATFEFDMPEHNGDGLAYKRSELRITKDGELHTYQFDEIDAKQAEINDLLACLPARSFRAYLSNPKIQQMYLYNEGLGVTIKVKAHGLNVIVYVPFDMYSRDDSGICTKRGDFRRHLECNEILFTKFPKDDCPTSKDDEKTIVPKKDVIETCDPTLLAAARQVCGTCPESITVPECLWETCLLGDLEFARSQVADCDVPTSPDEDPEEPVIKCGEPGKIKRKGTKVSLKAQLGEMNPRARNSCHCRQACQAAGGTEFTFQARQSKCRCYSGAGSIVKFVGDKISSNKKRSVAGVLAGSKATTKTLGE